MPVVGARRIPPRRLREGVQGADEPRAAEDAAAAEDESDTGRSATLHRLFDSLLVFQNYLVTIQPDASGAGSSWRTLPDRSTRVIP